MRPNTKHFSRLYNNICVNMTLGEQIEVFGTCGLDNILRYYQKEDAIRMAEDYLERRGIIE